MRPVATSRSHPLSIAAVDLPLEAGRIGLTVCPGMHAPEGRDPVARDLDLDLDAIGAWSASLLVGLLPRSEAVDLHVGGLADEVRARGMRFVRLPVALGCVPQGAAETAWPYFSRAILAALGRGERVVLHGRHGQARPALIAARLLVDLGLDANEALVRVRATGAARLNFVQEGWLRLSACSAATRRAA